MKIIAYLRVSTDKQVESGAGLNAQRDAINAYLAASGQTVTEVFIDAGISGTANLEKRSGLLAAINALAKGDSLIVQNRDRLGRDILLIQVITMEIAKRGAKVIALNGSNKETLTAFLINGIMDVIYSDEIQLSNEETSTESLINGIMDVISSYEVQLIRARTKAVLQEKKAKNQRMGKLPYGFTTGDGVHLTPDHKEQSTLRRIAELREAGFYQTEIAQTLNQEQLFNRHGRPWNQPMIHLLLKGLATRLVKE